MSRRCLVGQHLLAAAQKSAVAARHDALLVAQDDMTAMRSSRTEKRQQLSLDPFDMRAPAVARSYRFLVEASATADGASCRRLRVGKERATSRGAQSLLAVDMSIDLRSASLDAAGWSDQISQKTSTTLQRLAPASEPWTAGPRMPSRTEGGSKAGGPIRNAELIGVTIGGPHQLAEIGCEARGAFEGSHARSRDMCRLATDFAGSSERSSCSDAARHDDRDTDWRRPRCSSGSLVRRGRDPGSRRRRMAARYRARLTTSSRHSHRFESRMQPESDAMADARVFSLPDKAVVRGAYAKPRLGTDDRHNRRRRSRRTADRGVPCRWRWATPATG